MTKKCRPKITFPKPVPPDCPEPTQVQVVYARDPSTLIAWIRPDDWRAETNEE